MRATVKRLYFPCRIRLNGAFVFVLWYQDDRDGFVYSTGCRLLVADSVEALTDQAAVQGMPVEPEAPAEYDFDRIREWCRRPMAEAVDCPTFLITWNFLDDLAGLHTAPDTAYSRLSQAAAGSYDKLFWGNNLPSVTPPGERFAPSWSSDELAAIRRVFEAGLGLLEAGLVGSTSTERDHR